MSCVLLYSACAVCSGAQTEGGNPGTEETGVLDLFLLADTHNMIITSSSTFGFIAAGMAGIRPYYVSEHSECSRRKKQTTSSALTRTNCSLQFLAYLLACLRACSSLLLCCVFYS
jgi:hypothetical protein